MSRTYNLRPSARGQEGVGAVLWLNGKAHYRIIAVLEPGVVVARSLLWLTRTYVANEFMFKRLDGTDIR